MEEVKALRGMRKRVLARMEDLKQGGALRRPLAWREDWAEEDAQITIISARDDGNMAEDLKEDARTIAGYYMSQGFYTNAYRVDEHYSVKVVWLDK